MRTKILFLTVFALACSIGGASAEVVKPKAPPSGARENSFFFAYPGEKCPGGSERYKGPEQYMANETGAVYCKFVHNIYAMQKDKVGENCPAGQKPYVDARHKPDADVIWCQIDPTPIVTPTPLPSK